MRRKSAAEVPQILKRDVDDRVLRSSSFNNSKSTSLIYRGDETKLPPAEKSPSKKSLSTSMRSTAKLDRRPADQLFNEEGVKRTPSNPSVELNFNNKIRIETSLLTDHSNQSSVDALHLSSRGRTKITKVKTEIEVESSASRRHSITIEKDEKDLIIQPRKIIASPREDPNPLHKSLSIKSIDNISTTKKSFRIDPDVIEIKSKESELIRRGSKIELLHIEPREIGTVTPKRGSKIENHEQKSPKTERTLEQSKNKNELNNKLDTSLKKVGKILNDTDHIEIVPKINSKSDISDSRSPREKKRYCRT